MLWVLKGHNETVRLSTQNICYYLNVGHFGHGHFGHGHFGHRKCQGGRFGQNHKLWMRGSLCEMHSVYIFSY